VADGSRTKRPGKPSGVTIERSGTKSASGSRAQNTAGERNADRTIATLTWQPANDAHEKLLCILAAGAPRVRIATQVAAKAHPQQSHERRWLVLLLAAAAGATAAGKQRREPSLERRRMFTQEGASQVGTVEQTQSGQRFRQLLARARRERSRWLVWSHVGVSSKQGRSQEWS
jgi:hypothetical protein